MIVLERVNNTGVNDREYYSVMEIFKDFQKASKFIDYLLYCWFRKHQKCVMFGSDDVIYIDMSEELVEDLLQEFYAITGQEWFLHCLALNYSINVLKFLKTKDGYGSEYKMIKCRDVMEVYSLIFAHTDKMTAKEDLLRFCDCVVTNIFENHDRIKREYGIMFSGDKWCISDIFSSEKERIEDLMRNDEKSKTIKNRNEEFIRCLKAETFELVDLFGNKTTIEKM